MNIPFGIFKPKWDVKIKLRPSVWAPTPLPGVCLAKQTPLTAKGISNSFSKLYVFGNFAQFSVLHIPSLCNLKADQPDPMTLDCHTESPENNALLSVFASIWRSCSWNSSAIILAFASSLDAHGKLVGSDETSQNGLAVRPSICSSDGCCPGDAGSGGGKLPRALKHTSINHIEREE